MEYGGKGTQGISTWGTNLSHHIDHDGTGLAHRHLDIRTLVITTQTFAHTSLRTRHRKACHMDGAIFGHRDITIRRNRELYALLRIAIDVDNELVARTQDIVLRRGNVHLGFKSEGTVVKNVTTKDPTTS